MMILGLECSAVAASAAVLRDGELVCEAFNATRLTHSQTLLPMAEDMLRNAHISLRQMDCFAVASGPGSFTGLRIGIAAVKGMAQALGTPCVGVSTLEAMAWGFPATDALLCPVMDARCAQVYTAAFVYENGRPGRLWDDMAVSIEELAERLMRTPGNIILTGDGASLCYERMGGRFGGRLMLAPAHLRLQRAAGVCLAASQVVGAGGARPAKELMPRYLRLPQAERELRKKQEELV